MEQVKRRPWRLWVVLVLMIVGFILGGILIPVQPEISVAAEKLLEEPIWENFLGFAGPFYLVNTLPTLAVTVVLLVFVAYFTNRSLRKSQHTDMVPCGIRNLMEAFLELLYNLTEGSAGTKYARMIFPWFATIMMDEGLRSRYASAREQQAERFGEELVEIADKAEHEESIALVQAARLRIDTRKWVAAKLLPKKYGDFQRTEITGELDVKLTDEQLESRLAQLLRKAGVTAPAGGAGPQGKS